MTDHQLAEWTRTISDRLRASRSEVANVARSIPSAMWNRPSPLSGWTYKDLLAHLAEPEAQLAVLRAAVHDHPVDKDALGDLDTRNERRRQRYRDHTVDQLITAVQATGRELEDLLAQLTDSDEQRQLEDWPMKLGDRLGNMTHHDLGHLPQLRTALPAGAGD